MDEELSVLPAGEMGRILDRLVLLEHVIGRDHVRQVLEETECFDTRRCRLTREVIFWVVLAMGILTDLPIRQVFKYADACNPANGRRTAPVSVSLVNVWDWLPCAACSSGSSARWPRRRRREPSTRVGG